MLDALQNSCARDVASGNDWKPLGSLLLKLNGLYHYTQEIISQPDIPSYRAMLAKAKIWWPILSGSEK